MGSGTENRKKNDAPIIRRPKMIIALEEPGGVTDVGGTTAAVCLPSFDQPVTNSVLTQKGIKVSLRHRGETYFILIGDTVVGELNKKYSLMIKTCGALGIKYTGEIVNKNNRPYARFIRISK